MEIIRRHFDKDWGFGNVVIETAHYIVVVFDADPWTYHQIAKEDQI